MGTPLFVEVSESLSTSEASESVPEFAMEDDDEVSGAVDADEALVLSPSETGGLEEACSSSH